MIFSLYPLHSSNNSDNDDNNNNNVFGCLLRLLKKLNLFPPNFLVQIIIIIKPKKEKSTIMNTWIFNF